MDAFETVQDLLGRARDLNEQQEVSSVLVDALCDCLGIETVLSHVKGYAEANLEYASNDADDRQTWCAINWAVGEAHRVVVRQLFPGG